MTTTDERVALLLFYQRMRRADDYWESVANALAKLAKEYAQKMLKGDDR